MYKNLQFWTIRLYYRIVCHWGENINKDSFKRFYAIFFLRFSCHYPLTTHPATATYFDTKNDKTPSRKDLYLSRHSLLLAVNFFWHLPVQKSNKKWMAEIVVIKFGLNDMLKRFLTQFTISQSLKPNLSTCCLFLKPKSFWYLFLCFKRKTFCLLPRIYLSLILENFLYIWFWKQRCFKTPIIFDHKKLKKNYPQKLLRNTAQTAQTQEFVFQNVTHFVNLFRNLPLKSVLC